MQNSSVAAGFPCGISAKKRRYSSTAVGFPIRNDQKPYSQGISEGFPTCIGARRVRIYVRQRHFCEYQSYGALHSASTHSTYLPLFASSSPCRVLNLPLSRPRQHHVSVLNRPCDLPGSSNPLSDHERTWSLRKRTQPARLDNRLAHQDRIIDQAQSSQLALLANRFPDHHHTTPSRSTLLRLMLCSACPTVDHTLPLSRSCQHHVSVLNRPCDLPGSSNPLSEHERTWSLRKRTQPARFACRLAHHDRIIDLAQSTQLALLANRLPDHHQTTPSRPTRWRLMLCSACPTVDLTNASRCSLESIEILSGFTWESLDVVPHSFSARYALVMDSFSTNNNANQWSTSERIVQDMS